MSPGSEPPGPRAVGWRRRLRTFLWRASVEEEVETELDFHLEMRAREYEARGMTPAEARAAARARFGDIEQVKAKCRRLGHQRDRDMHRAEYLSALRQDITHAVRQLRASRGFTLVAVLTLALGIGATSTIFSAVHAALLRPFPFGDPDRVMLVSETWQGGPSGVAPGNFVDMRGQQTAFRAPRRGRVLELQPRGGGRAGARGGRACDAWVLRRIRRAAAAGAHVPAGRGSAGRRAGGRAEPQAVAAPVRLGCGRGGAAGPDERGELHRGRRDAGGVRFREQQRGPLGADGVHAGAGGESRRARPRGVRPARARCIGRACERGAEPHHGRARGALPAGAGRPRRAGQAAGGFSGRRLPGPAAGASGRRRAGAADRARGFSWRAARAAARSWPCGVRWVRGEGRIVRQLLTESAVLGLAGGAAGLLLAYWGVEALVAGSPPGVPRLEQARIDPVVLGFTLVAALASSVIFGLLPALRSARADLHDALKQGGRTGTGLVRDRVRGVLVAVEVALALTLLAGAGLLIRTGIHMQRVDPGFDPQGVLTARLTLPAARYADPAAAAAAFTHVLDELRAAPGVESAAIGSTAPLGPCCSSNELIPEGRPLNAQSVVTANSRFVTPGYIETLRIALVRGRLFTERDTRQAPLVMIVNEELARRAWPGEDPIGKRVVCCEGSEDDPRWKTVVGVVKDTRARGPGADVEPEFYLPIAQVPAAAWDWTERSMTIVARTAGDPAALTPAFREAVRAVDASLPVYRVEPMTQSLRASTAQSRFNTLLLTALGLAGLLLAAVGLCRAGSAIRVPDALKARPIISLHDGYLALLNQGT